MVRGKSIFGANYDKCQPVEGSNRNAWVQKSWNRKIPRRLNFKRIYASWRVKEKRKKKKVYYRTEKGKPHLIAKKKKEKKRITEPKFETDDEAEEYDYLFKTIVVGDGGVGKTALTLRFSKGFFIEDYKTTVGVDFHVKTITIDSNEGPIRSKLQIWDTCGQERFTSIRPMYYRGSLGALLIFDLTNSSSFEHIPQWIEEVRANVKTEIPLLLVGNKSDLVDQRAVSLEKINKFTQDFNLNYVETSAKTGECVRDCFYTLACLMIGSDKPNSFISNRPFFPPGDDKDRYPFPYIFNPPKPPDDFAMAPQVQVTSPLKEKDPDDKISCQYCGKKLTKEEQFSHSCKEKPKKTWGFFKYSSVIICQKMWIFKLKNLLLEMHN